MVLVVVLSWTVGIPVTVLAVASAFAWWRDRREQRAPADPAGSARVYQFSRRSRIL
jgi:hypothetical protein